MARKTATLTDQQRETLNAAEQILRDMLVANEVLMFSLHAGWDGMSVSYFTPNRVQYTSLWRTGAVNLADKIDYALELRADEAGRADQIKAQRIAKLKAELATLEPVA
jgi:hypothetical protein